ncbi:MAG TPA: hypothetical protein VIL34_00890 [Actinopolymorphaceae bacterium]
MIRHVFRAPAKATKIEAFAPTGGRVLGFLTLAIGAFIIADIVIEWRTWDGFMAALIVLAVCVLVWLALIRPSVVAYEEALVLRNVLSDTWLPWHMVESVSMAPVLGVTAGGREYRSAAVAITGADRRAMRRSRREARKAAERAMHNAPAPMTAPTPEIAPADYTLRRLEALAKKYGSEKPAETDSGPDDGSKPALREIERRWRWPEFAVLGAVIVLAAVASQLG